MIETTNGQGSIVDTADRSSVGFVVPAATKRFYVRPATAQVRCSEVIRERLRLWLMNLVSNSEMWFLLLFPPALLAQRARQLPRPLQLTFGSASSSSKSTPKQNQERSQWGPLAAAGESIERLATGSSRGALADMFFGVTTEK